MIIRKFHDQSSIFKIKKYKNIIYKDNFKIDYYFYCEKCQKKVEVKKQINDEFEDKIEILCSTCNNFISYENSVDKLNNEEEKKKKAGEIIRYMLKFGLIKKQEECFCLKCGISGKIKKIHYHHFNYNFPSEVIPLCGKCHSNLHNFSNNMICFFKELNIK